ncbi:nitronate monooxygenase [Enterococcus sp. HY326]|uniref:nitronate monooxygenase n=1 Tax=Enterococcus sp. HY326 TaxID=2971265 RepID=UPI00223F4BA4|nr:nitronate monooxygenase [Enterococcus sp. HY326]
MSLTKLLGIKYPLFQGAMAQISRYELVSAVSNAGGLGIIASGAMDGATLRYQIQACKELTDKPFAVNLMLMMDNIEELVDIVIEEGVPIVTTGAGTPKDHVPKLLAAGIKVFPVIATVDQAQKMEALGVHGVVAEGTEAGGHIGESSTMSLVLQVSEAVSIPVIAAGGIVNGRGIVASFALGAQGVQVGTRFLASEEVPIPESYKLAVLAAKDDSTVVTGRTSRAPVRVIKNPMSKKYLEMEYLKVPRSELEELTMGSLRKAVVNGDMVNGSIMAGQISGAIHSIRPVKSIIDDMFAEAEEVMKEMPKIFY